MPVFKSRTVRAQKVHSQKVVELGGNRVTCLGYSGNLGQGLVGEGRADSGLRGMVGKSTHTPHFWVPSRVLLLP